MSGLQYFHVLQSKSSRFNWWAGSHSEGDSWGVKVSNWREVLMLWLYCYWQTGWVFNNVYLCYSLSVCDKWQKQIGAGWWTIRDDESNIDIEMAIVGWCGNSRRQHTGSKLESFSLFFSMYVSHKDTNNKADDRMSQQEWKQLLVVLEQQHSMDLLESIYLFYSSKVHRLTHSINPGKASFITFLLTTWLVHVLYQ